MRPLSVTFSFGTRSFRLSKGAQRQAATVPFVLRLLLLLACGMTGVYFRLILFVLAIGSRPFFSQVSLDRGLSRGWSSFETIAGLAICAA